MMLKRLPLRRAFEENITPKTTGIVEMRGNGNTWEVWSCFWDIVIVDFGDSINTERGTKGGPIARTDAHFVANNMRGERKANLNHF